jgi:hypothetical protein
MRHYVNVEVDMSEVLDDLSTKEIYEGWSDKALWEVVHDIANLMHEATLRNALGISTAPDANGISLRGCSRDDMVLEQMIREARDISNLRLSRQVEDMISDLRWHGTR